MRTLWKGAKLEVESVIRETCDKALNDSSVSEQKRHLRAVGLTIIGEVSVLSSRSLLYSLTWYGSAGFPRST